MGSINYVACKDLTPWIMVIKMATVIWHLLLFKILAKLCLLGRESAGIEKSATRNVAVAGYAGLDPP